MLREYIFGRTYVFIDAANILYSQQTLGWRVDYTKLKNYLDNECLLGKIFFYTGKVGDNIKQQSFLNKLRRIGYFVNAKEVKRIRMSDNMYILKGNLDVELAIDAVLNMHNYDTILLLSGDSDFAYLLDVLKKNRRRVLVVSERGHVSLELLQRAKYIDLKKLRKYIEFISN
ncbi:NYN domain-containing protein [Patescibacteria group bacterium]|nr:NYN domain-containing protein [Patescibacteria group bacterium]MBU1123221.1 NYN domain-containing protein [Patescibacteria group bacterium]MBU1911189.1 NYN domain-containing protein [Patescibacteria group bacterium]